MAMPKVFISYGTQDAQSRELIKMLTPKLSGFEVFVDHTTLRGGDDWRHRLHTWLHLCSAAVLLLSDAALDSAWVTTEATILDHRRTIDDKLLVIPVLLGNVTPPDLLKPPYAALNLSASQWVRIGPGDLPGAKITEIAGLLQPIATHAEEGPLGRQRREVASLLRKIDDEIILTDADDVLEPDLQGWDSSPTLNLPLRVAHGLLTAPIEKVANAMEGLLAPLPSDVRRTLLDALSHVWIDVETAANLATAIKTWAAPAQAGRSGPLSRGDTR